MSVASGVATCYNGQTETNCKWSCNYLQKGSQLQCGVATGYNGQRDPSCECSCNWLINKIIKTYNK